MEIISKNYNIFVIIFYSIFIKILIFHRFIYRLLLPPPSPIKSIEIQLLSYNPLSLTYNICYTNSRKERFYKS